MSDLSYKLAELRPALRPVAESAAWVASFLIANAISQEPVYFLILLLVLGSDVLDTSDKSKGLFRDFIAGSFTAVLSLALNEQLGIVVGALVAVTAVRTQLIGHRMPSFRLLFLADRIWPQGISIKRPRAICSSLEIPWAK